MALLKTGVRYPIAIVSSFTYKCSNHECKNLITVSENDEEVNICKICGCKMRLISSRTEEKQK